LEHAKKMFDYVHKRGNRVVLKAIEEPRQDFLSGKDLFEKTLAHEKKVMGLIKHLVALAKAEGDQETIDFLQWFVKEQVEEEATPAGILKNIESKGNEEVDKELANRK